ncbi:MAG: phosphopantothenate/pantothenate synthetase [Nitrososphaeraceae archaeon]
MDENHIPQNHPRARSLHIRSLLTRGFNHGAVTPEGLIAHGRGEAFDYLLGESTSSFAHEAITAASCLFLLSDRPVISVNGNFAALCATHISELSDVTNSLVEINLFYRTKRRENIISEILQKNGVKRIYGLGDKTKLVKIPELHSERRNVDPDGIYKSDLVFVPLEDGDRTEALVNMKKKVITVDLNPLSRTARTANISIVDNIVRVVPTLIKITKSLKNKDKEFLRSILNDFNNKINLDNSLKIIQGNL